MLTVGISTSSGQFAVVIGENGNVFFDSSELSEQALELDDLLSEGLAFCKNVVTDIAHIIVDIGPGGTSRVRTGISFANSLAYSLGISVSPVSSMELAGVDVSNRYGLPVIHSIKSIKGNAYVGLFHHHQLSIKYGDINELVPILVNDIDRFVVVGFHRETILHLPSLLNKTVIDSEMLYGSAKTLITHTSLFKREKCGFPTYAQPIIEKTI